MQKNNHSADSSKTQKWIDDFIVNTYLLNDALEKGYYSDPETDQHVDQVARTIMIQNRKGYLYDEIVAKNLKIKSSTTEQHNSEQQDI